MYPRRGAVMSEDEEGDTPAAAASLQQAATAAINSAVIEPAQLSEAARHMLMARQQSDELQQRQQQQQQQQRKQSLPNSPDPPTSPEPARPARKHARTAASSSSSSAPIPHPSPLSAPPPESLSVFRLTQLNQLLRQHARRGNFIMLDLDETLMMTKHQPALLLSSYGVRMFQAYVRSAFADFATKNRLCRQLEAALKDKVLVESDTALVVAELQRAGCWVFGVTARYPELSTNTQRTLLSLGIDLTSSAPFPKTVIKDPMTGAVFSDGIIYCGAQSKGVVVSRFLENVVFAQLLQRAQAEAAAEKQRLEEEAAANASATDTDREQATPLAKPACSSRAMQQHDYTPARSSLRASPSTVSVAESNDGSPSSSNPPSPYSALNTPQPDFGSPAPRTLPSYARGVGVSPVPIAHSLRQRSNETPRTPLSGPSDSTPLSPLSGQQQHAGIAGATGVGLAQMPLSRSVSSPASMMDAHATPMGRVPGGGSSHDHATPSQTLYRSASVARALATTPLLYSATRGSRHRLRRKLASLGDDGEGGGGGGGGSSSQSFTPSIRRTMSVHGSPVFGPSIPTLTPSTISKRARAPPANQGAGSLRRPLGSSASAAAAQKRAMQKRRRIRVKLRVPRSALPPEIIFVDNEAYNVAEVQTGLKIAKKLKIPLRCYCFAPTTPLEIEELQQLQQLQQQQQQQQRFEQQLDGAGGASAAESGMDECKEPVPIVQDDVEADGDEEPSPPVDEAAPAADPASAVEPLQSPHTASIATALSLANLGSPVATKSARLQQQWPQQQQQHQQVAHSQQQAPSTPAGIYGFMLALGNVLPSSTVGVSSPHSAAAAATAATAAAELEYPLMAAAASSSSSSSAASSSAAPAVVSPPSTTAGGPASTPGPNPRRDSTSSMGSATSGTNSALNSPLARLPGLSDSSSVAAAPAPGPGGSGSVAFAGYERETDEDTDREREEEGEEEVSEADPEEEEEAAPSAFSSALDTSFQERQNAKLYDHDEEAEAEAEEAASAAAEAEALEAHESISASNDAEEDAVASGLGGLSLSSMLGPHSPPSDVEEEEEDQCNNSSDAGAASSVPATPVQAPIRAPSSAARRRSVLLSGGETDGADSAFEHPCGDETGGDETEQTETEHTDGTTEYTDETQTENDTATENDTDAGGATPRHHAKAKSKSLSMSLSMSMSMSLGAGGAGAGAGVAASSSPLALRPMLMPLPKQKSEAEPIAGLSATESYEVASAALGDACDAVLQVQMEVFAATGVILSNQQALEKVRQKAQPQSTSSDDDDDDDEDEEEEEDEDEDDESEEEEEDDESEEEEED